ncbi:LysE family translocator [Thiomicrospira microaerophila]|uniref:LysE family translocator n=1 Tax=Thiomicrospira microaerophila TaxID=406020 RepID=UPI00201091EB|nr:LysE family translocator [Thiomicrospira microaerophila]
MSLSLSTLFGLSLALILVSATPGPGVITTITRSLQSGFRAGFWITAGIVFMDLIVLIVTLSGLSLIAHGSEAGLVIIKILGAAFLAWLAWKNWHRPPLKACASPREDRRDFFTGIAVSLTNPVLFYLAFLPAFIDLTELTLVDALLLISLISLILGAVLLAYAFTAAKMQYLLFSQQGRGQIWLNRISALVMLLLAMLLFSTLLL